MKLYNKKTIKNLVSKQVASQTETRDAVLWDIDSINQICRVKIQGSANLITAHFPRNWKTTPYWLKRGNAVSIRHRSGVRGYVEVTGEGRAIPSPIDGSILPEPQPMADMVLTGCQLFATDPASMNILATGGTYRINGKIYLFDPQELTVGAVVMDDPAPMTMGSGTLMMMGTSLYTITIDTAPAAGYFRYDLCYVGTDGILMYQPGVVAQSNPVKPSLPEDTVMIGKYILVVGGDTAIDQGDIGAVWKAPTTASLSLSYDATHEWSGSDPETTRTIQVVILDQYGISIKITAVLRLEIKYGSGQVYSAESGWSTSLVTQSISAASFYTFTYKRDQNSTEHSPVFMVTLQAAVALVKTIKIVLLDSSGEPID